MNICLQTFDFHCLSDINGSETFNVKFNLPTWTSKSDLKTQKHGVRRGFVYWWYIFRVYENRHFGLKTQWKQQIIILTFVFSSYLFFFFCNETHHWPMDWPLLVVDKFKMQNIWNQKCCFHKYTGTYTSSHTFWDWPIWKSSGSHWYC